MSHLLDRQAIHDVVLRYCRGVDRHDEELTRSAYFEDAGDDHGGFKGLGWEFASYVNTAHRSRWAAHTHVVANQSVDIDGDVAHGETYVVAYLRRNDGDQVDAVGGRYVDRFERRRGEWRIADRVYVWEWSAVLDATASLVQGATFTQGQRDRSDPSYRR